MPGYEAAAVLRERSWGFSQVLTAGRKSIAIVLLLALWEIAPRLGLVDKSFLPPLSTVLEAWWALAASGELLSHITASLSRAFIGFVLAVVLGIPLGLLIGWYHRAAEMLNPLLELFRNTSPLALFPVFILLLGIGEAPKITIVVYACIWPVLLNTVSGVKNVDPLLVRSAQSLGLSPVGLFRKVILPATVPTIFTGIRLAGTYAILVLVAAEMIGAKAGLGYLIIYSQYSFLVPNMYAGIVTVALLGLTVNHALIRVEKKFSAWKPEAGKAA